MCLNKEIGEIEKDVVIFRTIRHSFSCTFRHYADVSIFFT